MTTKTTEGSTTPPAAEGSSPPAAPQTPPATPAPATPPATGEGTPPATPPTPPTAPQGAPERYEPFTVPDGVGLGESFVTKFSDVARELDLSQESAQKILDLAPVLQAQQDQRIEEAVKAEHQKWEQALKTDPDIGGSKLTETLATVNRVIDVYPGAQTLRSLLDETGFGGHPDVVRFIEWVGSKIVPDTKVVTGAPPGDSRPKDPQQKLAESYDTVT